MAAVDLGKRCSGVAVFVSGELVHATELRATPSAMARTIHDAVELLNPEGRVVPYVAERMRDYEGKNARAADLEQLRELSRALADLPRVRLRLYTAHAWKGQVPKNIHHRRILRELNPLELHAIEIRGKESLDAIGLGLFRLGRITRGGARKRHGA